jgi:ankyrin repeat protein
VPLHYASREGRTEIVSSLLVRGADIEAKDEVECDIASYHFWHLYLNELSL